MTRESVERGERQGNSMNDDKSSMAGELLPRTQNQDLDHLSLFSWKNLVLHQWDTHTHKRTCLRCGKSGESDGNVSGGEIFPSLIIIITVSSPFSYGQIVDGMWHFSPLTSSFLPSLPPSHWSYTISPPLNDSTIYPPWKNKLKPDIMQVTVCSNNNYQDELSTLKHFLPAVQIKTPHISFPVYLSNSLHLRREVGAVRRGGVGQRKRYTCEIQKLTTLTVSAHILLTDIISGNRRRRDRKKIHLDLLLNSLCSNHWYTIWHLPFLLHT